MYVITNVGYPKVHTMDRLMLRKLNPEHYGPDGKRIKPPIGYGITNNTNTEISDRLLTDKIEEAQTYTLRSEAELVRNVITSLIGWWDFRVQEVKVNDNPIIKVV